MAERQFGPYRLVRQIAVGGMAEIHLAKTKGVAGFEKYVALKMIHPNFAEDDQFIGMLVDEAKIAVQLNHGNIAQTFDLGRVGDTYYITMEYVDGADLYKILRRGSEIEFEMPLDICAFIAKEIASALDHAHRKRDHMGRPMNIVHRDVSPQNVLISYAGEVKLVDFGIAKATTKARQTAAGVIKGKYYYMSPEQAWGDQIDFRSDIFSAGIVLYEMITGQMLYLEEDLHRLLDMARKANIAPPSTLRRGVPPQLERIVMHALAKLPGDRYQSASDFASDLERFLHSHSPVFTAAKVALLLKHVIGAPQAVPEPAYTGVEIHEGDNVTHTLTAADLIHDKEEIRDENSVIFRMNELKKSGRPRAPDQPTLQYTDDDGGEHTMISAPPSAMQEDSVDATLVGSAPQEEADEDEDVETLTGVHSSSDEDGPTLQRDGFGPPKKVTARRASVPPPPALAAKIHSPAVSELRKPRASRKTPAQGVQQANVLQAIVSAQPSAPMPAPPTPRRTEDSAAETLPAQPSPVAQGGPSQPAYNGYPASPPPGTPMQMVPSVPPHLQPYANQQPYPYPAQQPYYQQPYPQAQPQMSPGALYQMHPYGAPPPQPMSLTGQMRLFEADEISARYKVSGGAPSWLKLVIAGVIAVSVAAATTFFIVRSARDTAPTSASIHVESMPPGADVSYDGTRLAGTTPMTIDSVPLGTKHDLKVELTRHKPHSETVEIPKQGGNVSITAVLKPITGKLLITSNPEGADIYIDGQLRGRTSTTINDIDMATAKQVELRLKDYRPYEQRLEWPANGEIDLDVKLER